MARIILSAVDNVKTYKIICYRLNIIDNNGHFKKITQVTFIDLFLFPGGRVKNQVKSVLRLRLF